MAWFALLYSYASHHPMPERLVPAKPEEFTFTSFHCSKHYIAVKLQAPSAHKASEKSKKISYDRICR
ncbi:hypothetical protein TrispH2_003800 [Trichoplax sp. H2]|nr:hypothetical protein TrispH2_003800 [Trichoplax sp. H2]|eukprot:RDD44105.1 hypothetical protein TrispH2_003800 [Trichoplax sp. H2]